MILKTIFKEEEPTVNGLIYPKGSLQKIKDSIQDRINRKTFFVFPLGFCDRVSDLTLKDAVGIVNSFEIKDGQGYIDIQFIRDTSVINTVGQDNLFIDFLLQVKVNEKFIVAMDLADKQIWGARLAVQYNLMGV